MSLVEERTRGVNDDRLTSRHGFEARILFNVFMFSVASGECGSVKVEGA